MPAAQSANRLISFSDRNPPEQLFYFLPGNGEECLTALKPPRAADFVFFRHFPFLKTGHLIDVAKVFGEPGPVGQRRTIRLSVVFVQD